MTWRELVSTLLSRKASATTASTVQVYLGKQPVWTPRNYEQLAKEGYEQNATVYACVSEIAQAIGSLDWVVTRRGVRGRATELETHPLLDLLARPNPFDGGFSFFTRWAGFVQLSGNGYIEAVTPNRPGATPLELYVLRPDRMKVLPHPINRVGGYLWEENGVPHQFPAEAILHSKLFHPTNHWYGLSPIEAAARSVDTDNESLASNMQLLQNGLRPSGALFVKGNMGDPEFSRLRAELMQEYGGAQNAGKPLLFEGDMTWEQLGLSPRDMDFMNGRKMSQLDICRVYKVPPELINLKESTYENRKEARAALYTEAVLPFAELLRDDLSNWLVRRYGDRLRLDFDRDGIEALQEDRQKTWARVRDAQHLTVNEKRLATGYDEHPDGDVLLVPSNVVPLDQVGETGPAFHDLPGSQQADAPDAEDDQTDNTDQQTPPDQTEPTAAKAARPGARDARWRQQMLALAPIERTYHARLRQYFAAQGREVTQRLLRLRRLDASVALETKEDIEILFQIDEATGQLRAISKPIFDDAVAAGGHSAEATLGVSGQFDGSAPDVQQRLTAQIASLRGIPERVTAYIRAVIDQALNDPAGVPPIREIADRITQVYRQIGEGRARTIARTETARAFADAQWSAWHQMGVREVEWLSAQDEAVRIDPYNHAIDTERRALGLPFSNGLRYPHAPEGAPGNVINCRCVLLPVVVS